MITHEITKPKTPNLYHQAKDTVLRLIGNRSTSSSNSVEYMSKIEYARWIEEIKKQFPLNSMWTLSALPYVVGEIPVPTLMVVGVIEIHWNAPIGMVHHQPRCIQLTSQRFATQTINYEPNSLRRLNEEELKLVHLRDYKTPEQKTPPECKIVDGQFAIVDADGKILRKYP